MKKLSIFAIPDPRLKKLIWIMTLGWSLAYVVATLLFMIFDSGSDWNLAITLMIVIVLSFYSWFVSTKISMTLMGYSSKITAISMGVFGVVVFFITGVIAYYLNMLCYGIVLSCLSMLFKMFGISFPPGLGVLLLVIGVPCLATVFSFLSARYCLNKDFIFNQRSML